MTKNEQECRRVWLIRKAEDCDIDQVVATHMSSFPGFFLTFLGPQFLRLLYREIHANPQGILHVAESNTRIIGFVAGVTEQAGFYHGLIQKRKWAFAIAALNAFARRPSIAPRLVRALKKSHDSSASAPASLMSIAVSPASASIGLGTALVQSFCEELRRRSICVFCLTTDRYGNDNVNNFYQTRGFELTQTFRTPEGRWMNEYVMKINYE